MGNAFLMGQGGGKKPDQIRAWNKYTIVPTFSLHTGVEEKTMAQDRSSTVLHQDSTLNIVINESGFTTDNFYESTWNTLAHVIDNQPVFVYISSQMVWEVISITNVDSTTCDVEYYEVTPVITHAKGSYIETIYAKAGTYPDIGKQGDYWYELVDSDFVLTEDVMAWRRFDVIHEDLDPQPTRTVITKILHVDPNGKMHVETGGASRPPMPGFSMPIGTYCIEQNTNQNSQIVIDHFFVKVSDSGTPLFRKVQLRPITEDPVIVYATQGTYPNNGVDDTFTYFYAPLC